MVDESPQQDVLGVIEGADLDEVYQIVDVTGMYPDWTVGTWQAEMVISDHRGQQVARIANFGTRDGEITLLVGGLLRIFLAGAFVATLPVTRPYSNATDVRVAAWRHRGALPFTLTVTETISGDISGIVVGSLTVHKS